MTDEPRPPKAGTTTVTFAAGNVPHNILVGVSLIKRYLSHQIQRDIEEVGRYTKPFVLAEGIPTIPDLEQLATNVSLGSIGLLCARPVAYDKENDGYLIREVRPKPGKDQETSSQGRVILPMHTDMTYLRFPTERDHQMKTAAPDFLILSCVKNDSGVATRIVTLDQIKLALSQRYLDALYKPAFTILTPTSVTPTRSITNRSILYKHVELGDMIRYNDVSCTAETTLGDQALRILQAFIRHDGTGTDIVLEPGQLLIFNNRQVLHGRGPIPNASNGNGERWFKRVYAQRHDTEYVPTAHDPIIQSA